MRVVGSVAETVSRMDAGPELTWTYLQRVSETDPTTRVRSTKSSKQFKNRCNPKCELVHIAFQTSWYHRHEDFAQLSEPHAHPMRNKLSMKNRHLTIILAAAGLLGACAKEAPPITVQEYRENSNLLEAKMVYCGQNRSTTKYEVGCVNARQAINLIAKADDKARRADLEAQSDRKRRALRRTQEAAAESRRHAAEAARLREEAEYLGQFEAIPTNRELDGERLYSNDEQAMGAPTEIARAVVEPKVEEEAAPVAAGDLGAIREELERRQN